MTYLPSDKCRYITYLDFFRIENMNLESMAGEKIFKVVVQS